MNTRIVVTGATGTIGSEIVPILLREYKIEVVCLYRSEKNARFLFEMQSLFPNLILIRCDLSKNSDIKNTQAILKPTKKTLCIHCAADVSWHKTLPEISGINIEGTINLGKILSSTSDFSSLIYISTAYTSLSITEYRNAYEESKAIAERKINGHFKNIEVAVFSCSLVVGATDSGRIYRFHGFYPIIKYCTMFKVPFLVGNKNAVIDIIPIDWVTQELLTLIHKKMQGDSDIIKVVAISGPEKNLNCQQLASMLYNNINRLRNEFGFSSYKIPPVLSVRQWNFLYRSLEKWNITQLPSKKFNYLKYIIDSFSSYLEMKDYWIAKQVGVTSQAPSITNYFSNVITYWFQQNKEKVLNRWENENTILNV